MSKTDYEITGAATLSHSQIDLLYKTPFPDCSSSCEIVKILGVGECESVCNHKFDADGDPLTAITPKHNI